MSNYQAIATVTATLQRILQATIQVDLAGARVTTVRPDTSGGTPDMGVNIYMYQANPNPAWRNADLRNRRPKGEIAKQAQAGLDLHYLLTFYGNEVELEPQRLLGSTVRVLIDQPILTPEMIRETITNPAFRFLENSSLAEQAERVTMVPEPMTTEDLSKIWSVFFQTPYVLSFAYIGSTVLIEGDKSGRAALPVRSRQFYITPNQPVVERVMPEVGENHPILLNTSFSIDGRRLERQFVQVLIGQARVTPLAVNDSKIRVHLSALPPQEIRQLRAGVQSLQVLHFDQPPAQIVVDRSENETTNETTSASIIRSNIVAFVLCPSIVSITVDNITDDGDRIYAAEITVQVDVTVGVEQRVFLMLNERLSSPPAAYVFRGRSRSAETTSLTFSVKDVQAGDYLVRIQVDSAESLLNVDETHRDSPTFGQYISPTVSIP
jgi:hypothetical protein